MTKGWKLHTFEMPDVGLTNKQVRFLFTHFTKLFGITDNDEWDEYLENLPKCEGLSIDEIYDKVMETLPKLLERISKEQKMNESKI